MIDIKAPKDCCGCTACASICNHNAITMEPDAFGFLYPKVDKEKCIDCGLCNKVCSFNSNYDVSGNLDTPIAYAARHKDSYNLDTSRSGGAFIALSDLILELGGVVYGVGWTDEFMVVHKRATTKKERDEFKGSKYTQSDLTGIFQKVKQDLLSGKKVLFSGTGCQIAGLKSYLGNNYREQLYLVDIVCHGVPSPYMWRDYLKYIKQWNGKDIVAVNFRDKSKGWAAHYESFTFEDDSKLYTTLYRDLFFTHINLRYSCYNCHFCNTTRTGDVSLADYWGWERTNVDFNKDDRGVSLVLCNTEKGLKLFDAVKERMETIPAELGNVMQNRLYRPSEMHPLRKQFQQDYSRLGFERVMYKYGMMGWRHDLIQYMNKLKRYLSQVKNSILK